MNAERLLAHYEEIAEAPDAVARLRRFILDLAVRGKLAPQDPNDEPATSLLDRIRSEKLRLLGQAGSKKLRTHPKVIDEPFDIPRSWCWTRIREVTADRGQKVPDARFSYIDVTAINKESGIVYSPTVLDASDAPSRARKIAEVGDVIYSCVRPYLLNVAIIEKDFDPPPIASTAFAVLNGFGLVLPRYLWIALRSPFMVAQVEEAQRGQAYPAINDADFAVLPLPLPPLAEQHRIVAKVDELMALCAELEAARTTREAARDRLAAASLARLNTPNPETFQADARFALDALPGLTARANQLKQLRQTILNLAVQGKLVPQDPTAGSASELLDVLAAERSKQVAAGLVPRPKPSTRDAERSPGQLPETWRVIALGDVCSLVTSGSRGWAEFYAEEGPGFVRAQNIRFGKLRLDDLAHVKPPANSEGGRTQLARGDLLVVITGAGVTNPALLDVDLGEAYVSQHVGLVRPIVDSLSPWFLVCLMAEAGGRGELLERAYGAGKPGLNLDNLRSLTVPLPPLAEQRRIVGKINQLMTICDELEASLTAAGSTRGHLFEALLAEALSERPLAEAA